LTSFRAAARHGEVDAQITTWARNLLTTTRLLQASAAEDPTMKRLLDDLELVLVQIAQYKSANPHRAEELELIEHSIERRGVIGKLHTNIPARVAPAGTRGDACEKVINSGARADVGRRNVSQSTGLVWRARPPRGPDVARRPVRGTGGVDAD